MFSLPFNKKNHRHLPVIQSKGKKTHPNLVWADQSRQQINLPVSWKSLIDKKKRKAEKSCLSQIANFVWQNMK
jgi:hypothetical protein